MHIGFDVSQTGSNKAGCGYFAYSMANALIDLAPENLYSLYPSFGDFYFDFLMPWKNSWRGRGISFGPRHFFRAASANFWNNANAELLLGTPDIIHSNNFWCFKRLQSSRLIYTFYDMGFAINPSWTSESNRVGCFDGVFHSAMSADWVVAISKASRDHYLNMFPHFPESRIRIIYPCSRFANAALMGVRPRRLKGVVAGRYWLNVGTIEPRKNQRRLMQAYARYINLGGEPMPMVLAGGKGWLMGDFHEYLDELGIADKVIFTGYISDEELIWLYQNCYANLYPSLFEGFGLPVLEGMQFGAPTLASSSTSLPEVVGNSAVLLDPENVEEWAQGMAHISKNKGHRDALGQCARVQASRFDWRNSAASLLQLYEEALASPKRMAMQ